MTLNSTGRVDLRMKDFSHDFMSITPRTEAPPIMATRLLHLRDKEIIFPRQGDKAMLMAVAKSDRWEGNAQARSVQLYSYDEGVVNEIRNSFSRDIAQIVMMRVYGSARDDELRAVDCYLMDDKNFIHESGLVDRGGRITWDAEIPSKDELGHEINRQILTFADTVRKDRFDLPSGIREELLRDSEGQLPRV